MTGAGVADEYLPFYFRQECADDPVEILAVVEQMFHMMQAFANVWFMRAMPTIERQSHVTPGGGFPSSRAVVFCRFSAAASAADGTGMAMHFLPPPDPSGARLVEGLEGVALNAAAHPPGELPVTKAMISAGYDAFTDRKAVTEGHLLDEDLAAIYRAMVLAGPTPLTDEQAALDGEVEWGANGSVALHFAPSPFYFGVTPLTDKVIMDDPLAAAPFDAAKAKAWWNMASPKDPAMQSGGESVRMSDADLKAVADKALAHAWDGPMGDAWRKMLDAQAYMQFPGYLVDAKGVDWTKPMAAPGVPLQAAGVPMGGYGTMGYPKAPNDEQAAPSVPPTPTAAAYRCPDCNAAEGEWHKRLCLVGAEIVRAPK